MAAYCGDATQPTRCILIKTMGEIKKIKDLLLAENLGSAFCPPVVFSKMLAAHNLDKFDHCLCSQKTTTTTTKKNPHSACILANARKDH